MQHRVSDEECRDVSFCMSDVPFFGSKKFDEHVIAKWVLPWPDFTGEFSKIRKSPLLVAALMLCFNPFAPVSARTMQHRLEQACETDIEKLCAPVKSQADELKACMTAKRSEVRPSCMKLFDASE